MDGIEIHDMLAEQIRRDGKYVAEDGKHRKIASDAFCMQQK